MDLYKDSDCTSSMALPFLGGVLVHQALFRRYELDNYLLRVASAFAVSYFVLAKSLHSYTTALVWSIGFFLGLCTSVFVYRAFFHRLKHFPGPFSARLSKFWAVKATVTSQNKWNKVDSELHQKYGDYVRVGPRELSIADPEAIVPVLGSASRTSKGPFYGSMEQSLHTTRNKEFHRLRRRVWDNAFKLALADFAPLVEAATDALLSRITRSSSVVLNDISQRYSFDVMCTLAFGKDMGYLDGTADAADEAIFKEIQNSLDIIGLLVHIPWILKVLEKLSKYVGPMKMYNDWSADKVGLRKEMKSPKPDLMGHLMAHTDDSPQGRILLNAESRLIVGAGSDTAAGALTMIFAYLSNHPSHTALLRAEIDEALATSTYSCLRPLPFLDATINEVLRLHPPITWGSSRVTPPEGLQIGNTYIPPATIISLPPRGIARDPRNFTHPASFLPERWTTRPDLIVNRAAFMPFLTGAYSCPGKGLAMMELRSVVARTVARFEFLWGEEVELEEWLGGVRDHITMGVPKLRLEFKERGGV